MAVVIDGTTGISAIQDGVVVQADLAANVVGNGPAFSAYPSAGQTLTTGVSTKIAFNTEDFDTNSCYDNTTNYRFTPTVAGYYQVNATTGFSTNIVNIRQILLYKNGSLYKNGNNISGNSVNFTIAVLSLLVYLNGSTDYIEIYALQNSGGNLTTSTDGCFQAAMVRAA